MGPVTADPCEHFEGLIAMEVVGQLSDDERIALGAHTEGCTSCRDERHDLMMLSMVLDKADPEQLQRARAPVPAADRGAGPPPGRGTARKAHAPVALRGGFGRGCDRRGRWRWC